MRDGGQELCASLRDERGLVGVHHVRVRYAETDQMGVAYHGAYVPWIEEGRTEWMRLQGRTYRSLEDEGLALAVTDLKLRYRKSFRYDDRFRIETWLVERKRVAVTLAYQLYLEGAEGPSADPVGAPLPRRPYAEAETTLVLLGQDGRPARIPEGLFGS